MEYGMEEIMYGMEWNGRSLSMEWKISMNMEYGKFLLDSIS